MHSTFSDGKLSPLEINTLFKELNFQNISITDHDTLDHIDHIEANIDKFDLNVIPGVEISCQFKQIDIHLLVYYVSKKIDFLSSYFNKYRLKRIRRVEMILLKFKKEGINLDLNDLLDRFENPSRLHIAQSLVLNGYAKSIKLAFKKFLIRSSKFYVPIDKISLAMITDSLKNYDCITSIAHPIISMGRNNLDLILKMDIDAIEVFHPSHRISDESLLSTICKENNYIETGGSDFHGWNNNDFRLGYLGLNNKKYNNFSLTR